MDFLGMGWFEILIVALVALLVLGPEKLPGYARQIGKFIRQFRKVTSGVSREITKAMDMDEVDENEEGIKKELKAISKSLEEDAAELRRSLSEEAASIEKTISDTTKEAKESLSKEGAEIARSLKEDALSARKEVDEGLGEAKKNLGLEEPSPETVVEYKPPPVPTEIEPG